MTTTDPPAIPPDTTTPPRPPARPTIHAPLPDVPPPRKENPSFWHGLTSLRLADLQNIHKIPCAREAFLAGIAAGFAFGGVKLVLRGTVPSAANWAVGTFCGTSVVVYEACHIRRYHERAGMQRAVEIMERQAREKGGRVVRSRVPIVETRETVGGEAEREGPVESARVPVSTVAAGGRRGVLSVGGGREEEVEMVDKGPAGTGRRETLGLGGGVGEGEGGKAGEGGGSGSGGKSWYKFW